MRLGFTGSRYGMTPGQTLKLLDVMGSISGVTEMHLGGCVGVDTEVLFLSIEAGFGGAIFIHPATMSPGWDAKHVAEPMPEVEFWRYDAKHPLERNKDIVNACDLLIAMPASMTKRTGGTWRTIALAEDTLTPHLIIPPEKIDGV